MQRNLHNRLNTTCEKRKYSLGISINLLINFSITFSLFKSDFPTIPVLVGDFVLQKITENIVGNWVGITLNLMFS